MDIFFIYTDSWRRQIQFYVWTAVSYILIPLYESYTKDSKHSYIYVSQ